MMNTAAAPVISRSRRLRETPWTPRLVEAGVKGFTVYNHMLLATEFDSIESDYWHLCTDVQVWDVSAERQVSISGPDAQRLIQWMTPRDIRSVVPGRCVYLPIADEQGRLVNDPVGLKHAEDHWWLSISDSDLLMWAKGLARGANLDVRVDEPAVWPLAVQGPKAEQLMQRVFGDSVSAIGFFKFQRLAYKGHQFVVARSGWSKQGGFEIYVDEPVLGQELYDELFSRGADLNVRPGCPNAIERIESSLLSYGNDMDSRHSPIEAGLAGFLNLDADIDALSMQALRAEVAAGPQRKLVGLLVEAADGPRPLAQNALPDEELLGASRLHEPSGNFVGASVWSPRYRHQLAIAMVSEALARETTIELAMADGSQAQARLSSLPFDFQALGIASSPR